MEGFLRFSDSRAVVTGQAEADNETVTMELVASMSFVAVVAGFRQRGGWGLEGGGGSVRERHARKEGSVTGQR